MYQRPNIKEYHNGFNYPNDYKIPITLMAPGHEIVPISQEKHAHNFIPMNHREFRRNPPYFHDPHIYYPNQNYQLYKNTKNQYVQFLTPNPFITPAKNLNHEKNQIEFHQYQTGEKEGLRIPMQIGMKSPMQTPFQLKLTKEKSENDKLLLDSAQLNRKKVNSNVYFKKNIQDAYEIGEIKMCTFFGYLRSGKKKADGLKVDIQKIKKYQIKNFSSVMVYAIQNLPKFTNPPEPTLQKIYDFYEDKSSIYICCEPMEEIPLSSFLEADNLTELEISHFIKELLQIINNLYKNQIAFPNLNLHNIRVKKVNNEIKIKIGNNGLFLFDEYIIPYENFLDEISFFSPRRAIQNKRTLHSDIWAIGVILTIILIGKLPYSVSSCTMILYKLKSNNFEISEKDLESSSWNLYSKEAMKFTTKCFTMISFEKLLEEAWLSYNETLSINSNQKELNDKLRIKKKMIIHLFELQNSILTYFSINEMLNRQMNYLILLCKNSDKNENGFIASNTLLYHLNQLNLEISEKEINKILNLQEITFKSEIDYTICISQIINLLNKPIEEDLKKYFKCLEHSLSDGFKLTFLKILIDQNFPFFEHKIRKLTFEFNLFKDSTISLNEFLLILENNCKAKSTCIKL